MMSLGASLLAAFAVGLSGGAHCALMCGGISSVIVAGGAGVQSAKRALFAQIGRIVSYAIAGALVATLSAGALSILATDTARKTVPILLGLAWIGIALQLLGWWAKSPWLARIGVAFWRRLQPLTRRVWPVNTPLRALAAGALWGWLPCAMSYAMLLVAAATAHPLQAAAVMVVFGIGTMPGTLLPALASVKLQRVGLSPRYRQVMATALLAFGIVSVVLPWSTPAGHVHHHGQ
jgi:uncharacterized protein